MDKSVFAPVEIDLTVHLDGGGSTMTHTVIIPLTHELLARYEMSHAVAVENLAFQVAEKFGSTGGIIEIGRTYIPPHRIWKIEVGEVQPITPES